MESRRKFLKRSLYLAPLIVTASIRPTLARDCYGGNGGGNGETPSGMVHGTRTRNWRGKLFH